MLKSYLGPLFMTFFIALFILVMQFLWKYIDDLVGKGFEWYIIAELLFYAASTFVPLALPLAILLASIMTLGNIGEHYELVAIKSSGIALQKILMPLVIVSLVICVAAFYFSNNVLPVANLKMRTLIYDVQSKKPTINIREGIFFTEIENYVLYIHNKDKDGKTIHNVMIFDHTGSSLGNAVVTLAKRGRMEMTKDERYLVFTLYDGCNYEEKFDDHTDFATRPFQRTYFKEQTMQFDLSSFAMNRSNDELFKDHYQMLNLKQLKFAIDSLRRELNDRKAQSYQEMMSRYAQMITVDSVYTKFADTVNPVKIEILDNVKPAVQNIVADHALNGARIAKDNVFFYAQNHEAREQFIFRHEVEWHRKFTLSFACLVLFFIGAPLGAIIRKGGFGLPIVFSVLFFVIFHVISMTSEKFVREGAIPAFQGMWMASLIYVPIGIFLTYKATTDSGIMDFTTYERFFNRIFRHKKYVSDKKLSEQERKKNEAINKEMSDEGPANMQ